MGPPHSTPPPGSPVFVALTTTPTGRTAPQATATATKTYCIGGIDVVLEDKPANDTNVVIATYAKLSCNKMSV